MHGRRPQYEWDALPTTAQKVRPSDSQGVRPSAPLGGARKIPQNRRPPPRARHLDVPERQQNLRIDGWFSICRPAPEVLLAKHLQASMANRLRWMVEVGSKPMHVVGVHVDDLPDARVL